MYIVHICMNQKLHIIRHCHECSYQVLHDAHIPSRYHSDRAQILLHALPQCWDAAAYAFVLPSPALEIFCQCNKTTMIIVTIPKLSSKHSSMHHQIISHNNVLLSLQILIIKPLNLFNFCQYMFITEY